MKRFPKKMADEEAIETAPDNETMEPTMPDMLGMPGRPMMPQKRPSRHLFNPAFIKRHNKHAQ